MEITPYRESQRQQLIAVWERSARATHPFVLPEDWAQLRELVREIDFGALPVYCLMAGEEVAGFIGVAGQSVEMLFLDPGHIGKGHGSRLMRLALDELGAAYVEVNEQNEAAVRFYQKFGFETIGRTPQDSNGKDYPLLKMKLRVKP